LLNRSAREDAVAGRQARRLRICLSCGGGFPRIDARTKRGFEMSDSERRPSIFFAIPCGEFFAPQQQSIRNVCTPAGVDAIIVEDHRQTQNLWSKITDRIDSADYFVADISSKSANVLLELGYAIREKGPRHCAIFIAHSISTPVDLEGFSLQKYGSLSDFQGKLVAWMREAIASVPGGDLSLEAPKPFTFGKTLRTMIGSSPTGSSRLGAPAC
jgi:hypothetical protein